MLVTLSGMVTDVRLVHASKADAPILRTEEGIVTDRIDVHCSDEGKVTDVRH